MMISRIIQILTKLFLFHILIANCLIAQQYGHWEIVDSTVLPHQEHASVVMNDGNVIVSGGIIGYVSPYSRSAEIYNVSLNIWNLTDSMHYQRGNQKMVLLKDGRILVIGGYNQYSCEIYDPVNSTWEFTDSLNYQRDWGFTASVLENGEVIVVGGVDIETNPPGIYTLKTCEKFDPTLEEWIIIDSLEIERKGHTATILNDGRLLIAGGDNSLGSISYCEVFNPITGQWSLTDSLFIKRGNHSAVLLPNGKVLVTGGGNLDSLYIFTCEVFDPAIENWDIVGVTSFPHHSHTSILLADSLILLVGGVIAPASWEIFNPKTFSSMYVSTLPFQKYESTVHLLPDGRVISIGGWTYDGMWVLPTATCLMYYPNVTNLLPKEEEFITFNLGQNYPNPFNSLTKIEYSVPVSSFVQIKVYDILGNDITTLVNEEKAAGQYSVEFNATRLPSGIYFYQIKTENFIEAKKLILLK